ncbi:PEP/pyruvate-binding domain-containing protein [Flectobacillus sp. DC10W]|uniref:PEP/pyruvate-binding domain-containing protein n=1 Tax=Flectobacillus longus TaxID=2984207 RepID=A0ABT6YM41_9BACT|nr:PEP/pyruvate-binding domain-containing protein [Flectobacillus longus]MDI9864662.1 PEP/pyruvate-binding domain-containing protein [Flectobacillus longus]
MSKSTYYVLILVLCFSQIRLQAQEISKYKFLAYGALPAWTGVAVDWNSTAKVYIYDPKVTRGHAEFVNKKLGRTITFKQFKALVSTSKTREYLPFFIYDLSTKPYVIGGQKYTYAVRVEDYSYDDTPALMANDIIKLTKLIATTYQQFKGKPLVVVNTKEKHILSQQVLEPFFKKQQLNTIAPMTLIKHFDGFKIEVLNEVVAVGRLVYVKNEKDMTTLTPQDIAIFEHIPERVPPLAGIITLEPQTPLSHINLLAKNRKTLNISLTSLSAWPELKANVGSIVEINPKFQKLIIKTVTADYATKFREKNQPQKVNIPSPELTFESTIPLNKHFKQYQKVSLIGAKANNYALIHELLGEEYVLPAYAIGFKPYMDLLTQGADKEINFFLSKKSTLNKSEKQKALARIRSVITKSNPSVAMLESLRGILNKYYAGKKVKLRSSTNCEDLPQFNGAGLYTSKGFNVADNDKVLAEKITKVYASLWNDEAFEEREYFGIDHKKVAMAILVSPAFVDEYANGVILVTPHEKSGNVDVLVNTQPGENEVANPKKNDKPEAFLVGQNGVVSSVKSHSNLGKVFIGNEQASLLLKVLRINAIKVHQALMNRQKESRDKQLYSTDIEFKVVKNTNGQYFLYFKQARLLRNHILPE